MPNDTDTDELEDEKDEDEKDDERDDPRDEEPSRPLTAPIVQPAQASMTGLPPLVTPPTQPTAPIQPTGAATSAITGAKPITAAPEASLTGQPPLVPPATPQMAPRPAYDKLQQLEAQGPAISRKHGVGGGILKALETAGTILSPGAMTAIPGTRANFALETNNAKRAADEEAAEIREKGAEAEGGLRQGLTQAQTAEAQANAQAKLNPKDKPIGTPFQDSSGNMWQAVEKADGSIGTTKLGIQGKPNAEELKNNLTNLDIQFRNDPTSIKPEDRDKLAEQQRQDASAKLPEEIKAKIPDAPVAADKKYKQGYADPQFQKDTAAWSSKLDEAQKSTPAFQATQAQRDFANAIREQTAAQAAQNRDDKDRKPVIGVDPQTGREVMVPAGDAQKMGLQGTMDAPSSDVSKALSARHFVPLSERAITIIDKLDKDGKLGPLASRWNEFMAGKYGSGDKDFEALRTVMGLGTTLLMNLHVGSRGGSYMMEHFEDLANAGKMNAETLKSGLNEEIRYAKDRAMLPANAPVGGGKTYTDEEVQAAAKAHNMNPQDVEAAYKAKGYKKQ